MRLPSPSGRAAVLLATAAVPLPLHHSAHHADKHHHHRHAHRVAPPNARQPQHRHKTDRVALARLVATTTARDAAAKHSGVRARAAGDPSDTISDFKFAPGSITVHVGDTITWTNDGPSPHSATANNQSFDTGILKKGQSASHTFSQAGTFTYFCTVHPFMHGTVVVVADHTSSSTPASGTPASTSASGSGSAASTTPATATSATPTASSQGTLPLTGMDSAAAVVIGVALAGGGFAIRRRIKSGH
jgi:LPXTG-motif cell wall-anchored protein